MVSAPTTTTDPGAVYNPATVVIRKFRRDELESEPHQVFYKDIYPWDAIEDTPFSASLSVIEPGGVTMMHGHDPAETFIICRGSGTMTIDQKSTPVSAGDVVYLEPRCVHNLRNDSQTEELMFLNIFWNAAPASVRAEVKSRLIVPSPPTSNGPLHVGHLSGPYLIADVMRRYYRSRGIPATFVCLTDEHQSYVVRRAQMEGRSIAETAAFYSDEAIATLHSYRAEPDVAIFPSRDLEYQKAVRAAFARLMEAGRLEERDSEGFYCERCRRDLYDGFVIGACPHCGSPSHGFACESCCLPNATIDLKQPLCVECGQPPAIRKMRRLVFPLSPFKERLTAYHAGLRLTPKLRSLARRMVEMDAVPATQLGDWGIGLSEGRIISPWFEVALAMPYLIDRFGGELVQFFGYDNAFLYLVHDPAISMALGAALSVGLGANEYLMIEDRKISTSLQDSDAREVLGEIPPELLRLYLAGVRPENARTNWNPDEATRLLQEQVIDSWGAWINSLGRSLIEEAASRAPAPADWSPEHSDFLWQLEMLLDRAKQGYERFALTEVSWAIHELVHRASTFSVNGQHLAGVLKAQRETGLALELAAVRTLALMIAPLMPKTALQLSQYLGYSTELQWTDGVRLVPVGQPLSPAPIQWELTRDAASNG